ncbi:energy-coupling factor transporter transmembrane component T family protein [Thermofilum pendens]|uniref:Cobalt transport protein n=1 Tax=Thermofilum pendens (strain DSM 2475 / Hrk 5) TaxID=368408 RepID=A1S0F1_THEPD|nr:energy-coupling factor transporter transmembrane component T [Thermofilum pendens]ABL78931.1 cobalt transport protein [Thermofilum pendens Hrk 5]
MSSRIVRYIEGSSIVHRLDPRVKLFFVGSVVLAASLSYNLLLAVLTLALGLSFYLLARLPFSKTKNTWKFILIVALVLSFLNYLFVAVLYHRPRGELLEAFMSAELLSRSITPVLKLLAVATVTVAFVYTTPPHLYAPALGQLGLSYRAAYAVHLGFRYFPQFVDELRRTLEAQMARGYRPRGGKNPLGRILAVIPLIVPVTVSATLSIYDVSDAMELRGFGGTKCHTWYRKLSMKTLDKAFAILSAVISLVFLALYVLRPLP